MSVPRRTVLHLAAFLSGFAALLFETLWFHQAGLVLGNSIWASALVLSSFMAGLALGNGLSARLATTLRRPVRFYAGLELAIGLSGVLLVWLLPQTTPWLATLFGSWLPAEWLLQPVRFSCAFALLAAPAAAMGATLPTLVRALERDAESFGRVLGRVYGWNTLGAVVGAASSELFWIEHLGIVGSGAAAAVANAGAAALALALSRRAEAPAPASPAAAARRLPRAAWASPAASFLSGGILLALEVVWFRFLSLYVATTSLAFAVMLAVVLFGIALGSLGAAASLRRSPAAHTTATAPLALSAGIAAVLCYAAFGAVLVVQGVRKSGHPGDIAVFAAALMLPVCLISGALFTFVGQRLHDRLPASPRATGLLTLANTLGAMLGPLLAGFGLLPALGMERSLFALAAAYGGVALLTLDAWPAPAAPRRAGLVLAAAGFVAALLAFPHGRLAGEYLAPIVAGLERRGERVIARREGQRETILYTRKDWLGEPLRYRLVTDGYSMSGTGLLGKRYMSLFAYLPAALHPDLRRALLISFGVGTTAHAILRLPELEHLTVVDISPEILEMSDLVFPDPHEHPLRDPRVRVVVEDGRHFLETTRETFDLITAEPPPPAYAGVVNLYTREYFRRLRDRLAPGGFASYWLPVGQLQVSDAQAIIRAFCDAFPNCSLWEGTPSDWILLGQREPVRATTAEDFRSLWAAPAPAAELAEIGVERPEQLLLLLLAGATELLHFAGDTPPLVDNWPNRAPDPMASWKVLPPGFQALRATSGTARRLLADAWLRQVVPESLRKAGAAWVPLRRLAEQAVGGDRLRIPALDAVLRETDLTTLPLWLVRSGVAEQGIVQRALARGGTQPELSYHLGAAALSRRDFAGAAAQFARVRDADPLRADADYLELYTRCRAGDPAAAQQVAHRIATREAGKRSDPELWAWAASHCSIQDPTVLPASGSRDSSPATPRRTGRSQRDSPETHLKRCSATHLSSNAPCAPTTSSQ